MEEDIDQEQLNEEAARREEELAYEQELADAVASEAQMRKEQAEEGAYNAATLKKDEAIINSTISLRRWMIIMIIWDIPICVLVINTLEAATVGTVALSPIAFVVGASETGMTWTLAFLVKRKIREVQNACKITINVKRSGGRSKANGSQKKAPKPKEAGDIKGNSIMSFLLTQGGETLPFLEVLPINSLWVIMAYRDAKGHKKAAEKEVAAIQKQARQ